MDAEPTMNNGEARQDGRSRIDDVLAGAIDIHVHAAPDVFPRKFDDVELAMVACDAGYRGLLLKCHHFPTMGRAFHVRKRFPDFAFYGGLALNSPTGGLNPCAVEQALAMEAKEIWFPTLSAAHHRRQHGLGQTGLAILDSGGRLRPAVNAIVKAVARADAILGTGHLSEAEISVLVAGALDAGVRKIVITHPEWPPTSISLDLQARLAETGHVYFERCYIVTLPGCGGVAMREIAEAIRAVGWQSTVLATDLGQRTNPCPIGGMRTYVSRLHDHGFTKAQLRHMVVTNPARLLGLESAVPARDPEEVRASA
jgi:hypothetical protein